MPQHALKMLRCWAEPFLAQCGQSRWQAKAIAWNHGEQGHWQSLARDLIRVSKIRFNNSRSHTNDGWTMLNIRWGCKEGWGTPCLSTYPPAFPKDEGGRASVQPAAGTPKPWFPSESQSAEGQHWASEVACSALVSAADHSLSVYQVGCRFSLTRLKGARVDLSRDFEQTWTYNF